ncbi:MAG: glucosamine inositolphosphorylceramide transferase family protein [Pseudomonadota bacterium]
MSARPISAIRFGVFLHGRSLHDWEWESIDLLRKAGASCLFILGSPDPDERRSSPVRALDALVLQVCGLPRGPTSIRADADAGRYQPAITCTVERGICGGRALTDEQQKALREHRLAFILFFGVGEAPEGLAGCAEFGVWHFTHSSEAAWGYPFVQALRRGADIVAFGLEQIAADGRRRLLRNGHFRARGEPARSVTAQVLGQASRWPLLVLRHFLVSGQLPHAQDSGPGPDVFPQVVPLLLGLLRREVLQRVKYRLKSYLVLETWNIGLAQMDFGSILGGATFPKVALLPPLRLGHYLADPFVLSTTPKLTLLAEEYSDFGVGRIVEVAVNDPLEAPQIDVTVRLQSPHHLSYPFLLREDGVTYCLPECHQSGRALLYRYDDGRLTPVADLVPGARVTDGTVVFHDGLYWLFCGLEDDNDHTNLHLFFSRTLHGPWSPHPLNPVKTDVRSARPAGPIVVHEGMLYRPAQDCSKSYGYGVSINRIDRLTVDGFQETVVATIGPAAVSKSCKGVHTLSFAGGLMVIDVRLDAIGLKPILVRLLRRMRRMAAGQSRFLPFRSRSA